MQASKFTVKTLSRVTPPTSSSEPQTAHASGRLRELTRELRQLEEKLRLGGGRDKVDRQHKQGKLTARERIDLLFDKDTYRQEIGLLVAYDQYKAEGRKQKAQGSEQVVEEIGQAPAAGVVTTIGSGAGREVGVVAHDATVKRGSGGARAVKKILRAEEGAKRSRVAIIFLVDLAGVNLSYHGGGF